MIDPILISHLLGDFVFQNDTMAAKKKESHLWCFIHIFTYLIPFVIITDLSWIQLLLIGIQHFFQDRYNFVHWSMIEMGKKDFAEKIGPWSVILVDNIYHLTWIYFITF